MIQKEGPGWRVARDLAKGEFSVLIGGKGWAFELTETEWAELCQLLYQLVRNHEALTDQLMAEEAIQLELEKGSWWGCLEGDRDGWNLSVILSPVLGRGVEGSWPAPASMAVVAAIRTMWDDGCY